MRFVKNFFRVGQVKDSDLSAVAEFMPVSDIFKEDFPCIGLVEHSDLGIIAEPSAAFDGFQHYLVSVRPVEDLELDFFPEAVRVVFDEFKKNLFCVRQLKQPGEKLYTGQYAVFVKMIAETGGSHAARIAAVVAVDADRLCTAGGVRWRGACCCDGEGRGPVFALHGL